MKIYSVSKLSNSSQRSVNSKSSRLEIGSAFGLFGARSQNSRNQSSTQSRAELFRRQRNKRNRNSSKIGFLALQSIVVFGMFAGLILTLQSVATSANIYEAAEEVHPNLIIDFEQQEKIYTVEVKPVVIQEPEPALEEANIDT